MSEVDEKFIKINKLHPFYEGRVIVNNISGRFSAEIAIVHSETKKIFQYVDTTYGADEAKEALDLGIQILSDYLLKKKRN